MADLFIVRFFLILHTKTLEEGYINDTPNSRFFKQVTLYHNYFLTWVSTSQSEEWPDRQLLVQGRVTQERLLLQLLKLLRAGEAQGVWPQVGPGVDEGMVQRLCNDDIIRYISRNKISNETFYWETPTLDRAMTAMLNWLIKII